MSLNRHYTKASLLIAFAVLPTILLAQSDADPTADLKKQKESLQLQLDILNLQKSLASAQKAPSDTSALKDQLQTQKDIADLKAALTTSEVGRVKAEIGSINTANLPKGDATLTSVDIQPTIIGYGALKTAISQIEVASFCSTKTSKVVLGPGPQDDVALFSAYTTLIKAMSDDLDKYQKPPDYTNAAAMFVPPAAIFAGIDAVVALGSLFKIDVTMNGVVITPNEKVARFLIAEKLKGVCVVLDPSEFAGPVLKTSVFTQSIGQLDTKLAQALKIESEIKGKNIPDFTKDAADAKESLTKFNELTKDVTAAKKKLADPKVPRADKTALRLAIIKDEETLKHLDPKADKKKQRDAENYLRIANDRVDAVDKISAGTTKLTTALYKVDDAGTPFLTRMLKAEALSTQMEGARFLILSIAKIGGNSIVKKNAFHTSIRYAGGVVVAYELKETDGLTVILSGQKTAYSTADGSDQTLTQ